MDQPIQLLRDADISVGRFGEPQESFQKYADVWARIIWLGSKERFQNERRIAIRSGTAVIWFRDDVHETHRFTHETGTYKIIGLKELGNKERLEISFEQIEN